MQIDFPKTLLKRWRLPEGILALKRQPANAQEALEWLRYFEQHSISIDVGLMQVSTAEAHKRGLDPEFSKTHTESRSEHTAQAKPLSSTHSHATTQATPAAASTTAT
jgi:hypothetical protein